MTGGPGLIREPPTDVDHTARARAHRSTRLRAAMVTGGTAKALSVAVQLVAVGIALRALGPDAFGSYLVLAALVAWLGLASVGVGPGLTQRIVMATANGDVAGQATAFSSSVALAGLFALLGAVAVSIVAQVGTPSEHSQSALSGDIRMAALVLGLATAAQVWLSVVEAAQLGHQEQYFANMFQALGLACVLVILLTVGPSLGTVTAFVAATACPPVVAKVANAALYVARRRYLLTSHFAIREAAGVLSTSMAFAAMSVGSTASQQVGFLWLAFVAGPVATVPLGVMFRLNSAAFGVVYLGTQPLWPAVADAAARHDSVWARRAYRRASWLTVSYAVAYAVGIVTFGSLFVRLWTGSQVEVPVPMTFLFGAYFVALIWAHVNAITLVGLGKVWVAACVTGLEAVVSILGALLLVAHFGATGVILSLLIATALVSGSLLPFAVRRSWPLTSRIIEARPVGDRTGSSQ
jgi:O-antigen/teichoic acid export membrane protein